MRFSPWLFLILGWIIVPCANTLNLWLADYLKGAAFGKGDIAIAVILFFISIFQGSVSSIAWALWETDARRSAKVLCGICGAPMVALLVWGLYSLLSPSHPASSSVNFLDFLPFSLVIIWGVLLALVPFF